MFFIFATFATWRLARMLMIDEGPFRIFSRFRAFFIKETERGTQTRWMVGDLLLCMWCTTTWTAIPFALYSATDWFQILLYVLSLSGAATLLHTVVTRLEN